MDTKVEFEKIILLAKKAGESIVEVYNTDEFRVEKKIDDSPVTIADKISNKIIEAGLKEIYPEIPIISEESKEIPFSERKSWKKYWCVDPLDGTKEFINRNGEFTVNIALIINNKPFWGLIYVPVTNEVYYGGAENGSFKVDSNGITELKVSNNSLTDNLNVVQSRSHSGEEENEFYSKFKIKERLSKGSSLKICLVADGKAELYFRGGPTWEWDTAAGHAILLGAGGYFVNKDKSEIFYNKQIMKNFGFIISSKEI